MTDTWTTLSQADRVATFNRLHAEIDRLGAELAASREALRKIAEFTHPDSIPKKGNWAWFDELNYIHELARASVTPAPEDPCDELTEAQLSCGYCLYGPPALCTCGTCESPMSADAVDPHVTK